MILKNVKILIMLDGLKEDTITKMENVDHLFKKDSEEVIEKFVFVFILN